MAYIINSGCISCGACSEMCPVNAISQGKETYVINQYECVECGTCIDECPMEAIDSGDDLSNRSITSELKD